MKKSACFKLFSALHSMTRIQTFIHFHGGKRYIIPTSSYRDNVFSRETKKLPRIMGVYLTLEENCFSTDNTFDTKSVGFLHQAIL